jgi:TolB-like protein/DNA-binding winged helix-turn-helix (wHTH) protein
MEAASSIRKTIRFGAFELDVRAGELRKHGIRIRLQDQPFRVLEVLLEHAGEVVKREELQRQIWPSDTFVDFDRGLNNAVKRLREALNDSADQPSYIETLPKRGYRFVAAVELANGRNSDTAKTPSEAGRPFFSRRLNTVVLACITVIATAVALILLRNQYAGSVRAASIRSIAVLPLQNLSGDPEQEYFAYGMTDELITDLSQIGALRVASHQSVQRYAKSDKSLPEIARELNVDAVVEGSVQRAGDKVRVSAQLIHGVDDRSVWAKDYEGTFQDALNLESRMASAIADEIRIRMTEDEKANIKPAQPRNPKALEAFLEGSYHLAQPFELAVHKNGTQQEMDREFAKGMALLDQAIQEDPSYIPAYQELVGEIVPYPLIGLGDIPHAELREKARVALNKLLVLDENNIGTQLLLAQFNFPSGAGPYLNEAEDHYRTAIQLSPDSALVHEAYAEYLDDLGHFREGMKEHQKAQELDPNNDYLSPSPLSPLTVRLERKRKFMLSGTPTDYDYWERGTLEYEAGQYDEAVKDWDFCGRNYGWAKEADELDRAYEHGGINQAVRAFADIFDRIAKEKWFPREMLILIHQYAGDRDAALSWLETCEKEGYLFVLRRLRSDYHWDPYRSDPRFQAVADRVGLPSPPMNTAKN